MESRAWLFVSGTASIVGHQSRHREDIVLQCNEVLENIEQLLKAADDKAGLDALAHIKVYLRHAGHLEVVREALRDRLKHGEPSLVLQGELCRTELLLEIEGLAMRECT
jgi:chorismate lyase/3-hydroxybenzoate synthase